MATDGSFDCFWLFLVVLDMEMHVDKLQLLFGTIVTQRASAWLSIMRHAVELWITMILYSNESMCDGRLLLIYSV